MRSSGLAPNWVSLVSFLFATVLGIRDFTKEGTKLQSIAPGLAHDLIRECDLYLSILSNIGAYPLSGLTCSPSESTVIQWRNGAQPTKAT